ncbi:hypothetical protein [Paenibacillus silvae]|uniref:Uncharacterized protein n=1 Tax=Paenibacillus silvae TaxID=1325358 RepID=A0A2W6NH98_9BACL|nr:hypothetical protein [Paenibacillus silvae]PZT55337.1 hypothetical protein DN757_12650 [Paenibacillus silvae]
MKLSRITTKVASGALALSLLLSVSPVLASDAPGLTANQLEVIEAANIGVLSEVKTVNNDGVNSLAATNKAYTVKYTRGSFLAWSDAVVDWTSNGDQITSSSGSQDAGYVFPNIVRKGGITKQSSSAASYHIYLSKTTIGAGVVSPWGDVTVYESDFSDYIKVNKDGSASNY